MLMLPMAAIAADNTTLNMVINFTNTRRTPVAAELPAVNSGTRGPVIDLTKRTVRIANKTYQMSGISGFTFEMRESTGVAEIIADKKQNTDAVYSLDGRLVSTKANSPAALPKGIYIVNGKKMIIK